MPTPPLLTPVQPSAWWHADNHADRRPFLLARGRIKAALRGWFEAQGFVEVETSTLQVSPGNETHLHGFATELIGPISLILSSSLPVAAFKTQIV